MRTPATILSAFLTISLFGTGSLPGQTAPKLRIQAPVAAVSGTQIETSAHLELSQANVLSWSLSVSHQGLTVLDATASGTDFERLSQDGYVEAGIAPAGAAYYSLGVLSFTESVTLPAGTSEVLRATCLVSRKDPGQAVIVPTNGLTIPGDDREFANEVLVAGGEVVPLETSQRVLTIEGCAGYLLALQGTEPEEPPGAIEIRRGSPVSVDFYVQVKSPSHLEPSGFTLGASHDAAVLDIEDAGIIEDFRNAFVKSDGFARIEISERGFAASVLSSAGSPATLPPGVHHVLSAEYRFGGQGTAGETIRTSISLEDGLPLEGASVSNAFLPGNALPCALSALPLEIVVAPDLWIRGDTNGDGTVDISDAVHILAHLFRGSSPDCLRAMEVNSDGTIDLSDAVSLLSHLFVGGTPPAPPFPGCGEGESTEPCEKNFCMPAK